MAAVTMATSPAPAANLSIARRLAATAEIEAIAPITNRAKADLGIAHATVTSRLAAIVPISNRGKTADLAITARARPVKAEAEEVIAPAPAIPVHPRTER